MFMSLLPIIICIGIAWLPLSDITDTSTVISALIINVIYFGYNTHEKYMFLLLDLYTGKI